MIHSFEKQFELWIWTFQQHVIVMNFCHVIVIIVISLKYEFAHSPGFEMVKQATVFWKAGTRISPKISCTFVISGVS